MPTCSRNKLQQLSPLFLMAGVVTICITIACGVDAWPDGSIGSHRAALITRTDDPDCPPEIPCDEVPAAFAISDPMTCAYGNYDLADRERDGLDIRYIVIHTTEGSYDGTIDVFQNPAYESSAHYLIRSSDGHLAKLVSPTNVAWHDGNWYFNMHAVGIEHEAYAADGHVWFTDEMYRTSAALVRFLARRYDIPLDREHIIGHDEVPGRTPATTPGMHWDPGVYWDWGRFMRMLGPDRDEPGDDRPDVGPDFIGPIRIEPHYARNEPQVSYCDNASPTPNCYEESPQPSNFFYLRQGPSTAAPYIVNSYLATVPADRMNNWGNKVAAGRLYYRSGRSGDWDAIYFGGQTAWFYNPGRRYTRIPLLGHNQSIITPRAGNGSIPVYGSAYPAASTYKPPTVAQDQPKIYDMPEGQRYVAFGPITADFYWAKVWAPTLPASSNQVVRDKTPYFVISFNHRLAVVHAEDVTILPRQRDPEAEVSATSVDELIGAEALRSSDAASDIGGQMPLHKLKGMQ